MHWKTKLIKVDRTTIFPVIDLDPFFGFDDT